MCYACDDVFSFVVDAEAKTPKEPPGSVVSWLSNELTPTLGYVAGDELFGKFYGHTNLASGKLHNVMQWFRGTMPGRLLFNHF